MKDKDMEWKIGEIRKVNEEWYQCVKSITCSGCGFNNGGCIADKHLTGDCSGRLDGASVIFKKLEKVGEPELTRYSNDGISHGPNNLGLVIGREIPTYYMGVFKDEGSLYEYPTTPLLKSEEEVKQFFNDLHIEKKYLIIPVENFDPESL